MDELFQEFKPYVSVSEESRVTECIFEDVPAVHVPMFPGVHHFADKMVAMDDGRTVGVVLWHQG